MSRLTFDIDTQHEGLGRIRSKLTMLRYNGCLFKVSQSLTLVLLLQVDAKLHFNIQVITVCGIWGVRVLGN